jgi:FkbM family methyltransferase
MAAAIARTHRGAIVATLLCGAKLSLPRGVEAASVYLNGCLGDEEATTRCLERHLGPDDVFLDIGANLGFYTMLAATLTSGGHVHAFEPHPGLLAHLRESCLLNNLSDIVTVAPYAVSGRDGETLTLHLPRNAEHLGIASLYPHEYLDDGPSVSVPTTTIDTYLAMHTAPGDCVVKIDVEGAELEVLKGMKRLLTAARARLLIVEMSPSRIQLEDGHPVERHQGAATPSDIEQYLGSFGYAPFEISRTGELAGALPPSYFSQLRATTNVAFVRREPCPPRTAERL